MNYFDVNQLHDLHRSHENNPQNLKMAAKQLESIFLEMVIQSMHNSIEPMKSNLYSRDKEDYYQDMLNHQLSVSLSESGGIGLADIILQQLQGHQTTTVPAPKPQPILSVANPIKPSVEKTEPEKETIQNKDAMEDFISTLMPHAKKASELLGVDPKLLLAQAALETGWGKHILQNKDGETTHNLFNIKSVEKNPTQHSTAVEAIEYKDNKPEWIQSLFKSYASYSESFMDYVKLLQSPKYEKALENAGSAVDYLTQLKKAGYATDPQYVEKILAIYQGKYFK